MGWGNEIVGGQGRGGKKGRTRKRTTGRGEGQGGPRIIIVG